MLSPKCLHFWTYFLISSINISASVEPPVENREMKSSVDINDILIKNINNVYIKYFQDTYFSEQLFFTKILFFKNLSWGLIFSLKDLQDLLTNVTPNKSFKEFFLLDITTNNVQKILDMMELIEIKGSIDFFKTIDLNKKNLDTKGEIKKVFNDEKERFFNIFKMKMTLLMLGNIEILIELNDIQLNEDEKFFLKIFSKQLEKIENFIKEKVNKTVNQFTENPATATINFQEHFNRIFQSNIDPIFTKAFFETINKELADDIWVYITQKDGGQNPSKRYKSAKKNNNLSVVKEDLSLLLKDSSDAFFDGFNHKEFFSTLKTSGEKVQEIHKYTEKFFSQIIVFFHNKKEIIEIIKNIIEEHNKNTGKCSLNFKSIAPEFNMIINMIFILDDTVLKKILTARSDDCAAVFNVIINEVIPAIKKQNNPMNFESIYNLFINKNQEDKRAQWASNWQTVKNLIEKKIFTIPLHEKQTIKNGNKTLENKLIEKVTINNEKDLRVKTKAEEPKKNLWNTLVCGMIAALKPITNFFKKIFDKQKKPMSSDANRFHKNIFNSKK
jgi:hypothetical protein